jgi:pimeloyl-ACP methyl ester carboxylesterase
MHAQEHVALSADGVPIHYDVQGAGVPALVFVHGWCCDRHYWDGQRDYFAPHYQVVTLDLAGHGASGHDRPQWTVPAFGQDIMAVVERLGVAQVVLIGHSMGGLLIVEAARRRPPAVIGVVGVDTWRNIGTRRTAEEVAAFLAPFRANFVETARAFVRETFAPTSDPTLVEDIVGAMSAAPPHMAIGAYEALLNNGRNFEAGLQEITAPKITINASTRPTPTEAQRYGIEVLRMSGVGHFVMLEDPQTFNRLLGEAVQKCLQARARQVEQ